MLYIYLFRAWRLTWRIQTGGRRVVGVCRRMSAGLEVIWWPAVASRGGICRLKYLGEKGRSLLFREAVVVKTWLAAWRISAKINRRHRVA